MPQLTDVRPPRPGAGTSKGLPPPRACVGRAGRFVVDEEEGLNSGFGLGLGGLFVGVILGVVDMDVLEADTTRVVLDVLALFSALVVLDKLVVVVEFEKPPEAGVVVGTTKMGVVVDDVVASSGGIVVKVSGIRLNVPGGGRVALVVADGGADPFPHKMLTSVPFWARDRSEPWPATTMAQDS